MNLRWSVSFGPENQTERSSWNYLKSSLWEKCDLNYDGKVRKLENVIKVRGNLEKFCCYAPLINPYQRVTGYNRT